MSTAAARPGPRPKHLQARSRLLACIDDGTWSPGVRLPPETELHKHLRVGRQTLLKALDELVREGVIVRRRGSGTYVADRKQPPLIRGRHLRLGILWKSSVLPERIGSGFFGAMTRGALRAWGLDDTEPDWPAVKHGRPTRGRWNASARGASAECLGEALVHGMLRPPLAAVRAGKFDGLMTLGIVDDAWIEKVLALGQPAVLVDYPGDRFTDRADRVYADALPGYRAAVAQLAKQGARRIFFLGGLVGAPAPYALMSSAELVDYRKRHTVLDPDSILRQHAYRVGMQDCGLPLREDWMMQARSSGRELEDFARGLAAQPDAERPDAVVCFTREQANAVIRIFAERGLKLLGAGATDRTDAALALGIHVDGEKLGETAAALLLARLQQPERPYLRVGVPMKLILESENGGGR